MSDVDNKKITKKVNVGAKKKLKNANKERVKKIKMTMTKREEIALDKSLAVDNNVSNFLIILIFIICFVVGIGVGFILNAIALNGGI